MLLVVSNFVFTSSKLLLIDAWLLNDGSNLSFIVVNIDVCEEISLTLVSILATLILVALLEVSISSCLE